MTEGRSTGARVVVVGSLNEDVVIGLDRPPRPGETVTALSVRRLPGGKGANQAVAAARAGAAVAMVGRVGDDRAGRRMVHALEAEGVDASAVGAVPGAATGTAYVMVAGGESTIVVDPGANGLVDRPTVQAAAGAISAAAVLLTQLEVPVEAVAEAVRLAGPAGVRVVLTAAPARPLPAAVTGAADPLIVNAGEASFYLGRPVGDDAGQAARDLVALGARSAVVTLGAAGAAVADGRSSRLVPAVPVADLVDTTGAGDALAGTVAAHLAAGAELVPAVEAGVRAAAEVVRRNGAR